MSFVTADIHDAHPDELSVVDLQFRSFGRRLCIAGPSMTVKVHEDHRRVKELAEQPGEGRILVVDGGGSLRVGLMGDMMAAAALRNGWVGAVIFGAVRDSVGIDALDFGVKALGTTARRGNLDLGGLVGAPVTLGGVIIKPGDWIYADRDAVLVSEKRFPEVEVIQDEEAARPVTT